MQSFDFKGFCMLLKELFCKEPNSLDEAHLHTILHAYFFS
jgi:hypothetical protein